MAEAYYNEIDPYAAQWLRNLIAAGHIAPGIVDERSIEDVMPDDLRGFTQCHFFAGIGVWSYALRRAGWADDRPVWTGSCPCQPFSAAGKGVGFSDERHLWPSFHHLIQECRPAAVFGEQVASKDADPWIDLVQSDLEALGYAFGAVPFPSAGVGAPHIRDRLYWVANSGQGKRGWRPEHGALQLDGPARGRDKISSDIERNSLPIILGNTGNTGLPECERIAGISCGATGAESGEAAFGAGIQPSSMAHANSGGCSPRERNDQTARHRDTVATACSDDRYAPAGPTNGFWRDADWLLCRDGKWRPVEPGTFPLAHGATSRVGRLRAYGNAINAEAAKIFIEVAMEYRP